MSKEWNHEAFVKRQANYETLMVIVFLILMFSGLYFLFSWLGWPGA